MLPKYLSNAGLVILPTFSREFVMNSKELFDITTSKELSGTSVHNFQSLERGFSYNETGSKCLQKNRTQIKEGSVIRLSYDKLNNTFLKDNNLTEEGLIYNLNEQ